MRAAISRLSYVRPCLAAALCFTTTFPAFGQREDIAPVRPQSPVFLRPYQAPYVPPIRLSNSGRLATLVRAGKLYLTVQDAIAIALENNVDVEVARYQPILDAWQLERAQAGGALPGIPSGTSQGGTVIQGQGVRGSQAAAGVSGGGGSGTGTGVQNATITQIGPVTPTLDPVLQDTTSFSHISEPQALLTQSRVLNLIDKQRNYTTSLQQGFLSGGQATITYTEGYLNENAPTNILNPQFAASLQIQVQHNFLEGFGTAVNSRTINVAKINLKIDDLNFKSQVISVVVDTLNVYYGLAADYQDIRAKERALQVAQQFYQNNQKQVEIGTLAPIDITTAQAQVASAQQDLVTSQTTLEQGEVQLKNLLSRTGTAEPLLREAEIIPLDKIDVPENETLPPLQQLIAQARNNRVDIAAERLNLDVARTNALGTRNAVRPQLAGFGSASSSGQSGTAQIVPQPPEQGSGSGPNPPGFIACPPPNKGLVCEVPDPYFVGGVGTALGQMFRRNYPSQNGGVFFSARLRNRQNQADYAIDQLTMRQTELTDQKDLNQIAVDVSNQVVALQQARVRYQAAVKNRVLEEQLLEAEQKKFSLGASTTFNVVTQQRDLATSQATEISALVAYSNARIALGQTVGTTLEDTHVSLEEALAGRIARQSVAPANVPAQP